MPRQKKNTAAPQEFAVDGRARVVIENIAPAVDGGRFAIKRVEGERVEVEADCFADGHDSLACVLLYRRDDEASWRESADDRASRTIAGAARSRSTAIGRYRYTVMAWVDAFLSWRHDFARRVDAEDLRIAALDRRRR